MELHGIHHITADARANLDFHAGLLELVIDASGERLQLPPSLERLRPRLEAELAPLRSPTVAA